jgi:hypothetical protein
MGISLIERDCGKVAVPLKMKGLVEMPASPLLSGEMAGGGIRGLPPGCRPHAGRQVGAGSFVGLAVTAAVVMSLLLDCGLEALLMIAKH